MKPALSLAAHTLLLSFLSICLVLTASFFAISAAIKAKIKEGLKETLHRTERVLDKAEADFNRRNGQLLAILGENSELKAGIGLLREGLFDREALPQIRKTIEAQLRDFSGALDYDLLAITDARGVAVAVLGRKGNVPLDSAPTLLSTSSLINVGGILYQATNVPINLGAENLGSLVVGKKFDIASLSTSGYTALLSDNKVLLTTMPNRMIRPIEHQLITHCSQEKDGCEIVAGGEAYLTLQLHRSNLGGNYQLLSFQSIDGAMGEFTRRFKYLFIVIGGCGVLMAFILSTIASRSISRPLSNLVLGLKESEQTGRLRPDFPVNSPTKEVNLLADAFNRAAKAVCESQEHLNEAYLQFIESMAQALDARDPYTAGHSTRVRLYAKAIARAMGLPAQQIEIIDVGARLHDIGKIGIPDAVLQKPGRLTGEEFALIQLHPRIGKRILERIGRFQDYLPIVELHHEDYDGGGYPYGLKAEEIPLSARIVHVADVYDAVTSDRAYRKAMPTDRVLELFESGSGTQFDPSVITAFLPLLRQREFQDEASFALV